MNSFMLSAIVKKNSLLSNVIISCGGGVIKRKENMDALRQNGIVIYIKRDIEHLLVDDTRPLSSSKAAIQMLYNERYALYEKYSDRIIENNGTIEEVVQKIVEMYK